jgi:hypothetical protein
MRRGLAVFLGAALMAALPVLLVAVVSHSVGASIGTGIVTLICVVALWKGLVEDKRDYRG